MAAPTSRGPFERVGQAVFTLLFALVVGSISLQILAQAWPMPRTPLSPEDCARRRTALADRLEAALTLAPLPLDERAAVQRFRAALAPPDGYLWDQEALRLADQCGPKVAEAVQGLTRLRGAQEAVVRRSALERAPAERMVASRPLESRVTP